MNFKNTLSLLAIALMAFGTTAAQAVVDVQFNLRYTDPADESAGGTWDLLAQSDATNGLAGISVNIDGISGVTGVNTPLSAITPNASVFDDITSIFKFQLLGGGEVQIVAGDDLAGSLLTGVGTGSASLGNVDEDDLFDDGIASNNPWDNSALIASGTFGATRPVLGTIIANEFASPATDPLVLATLGDLSVRGDGVVSDMLLPGDANRDGNVNGNDFSLLALNFNTAGGWDEGNFNSSPMIDGNDFSALALNFNGSSLPPALSAASIPEPGTAFLAVLALLSVAGCRRKR